MSGSSVSPGLILGSAALVLGGIVLYKNNWSLGKTAGNIVEGTTGGVLKSTGMVAKATWKDVLSPAVKKGILPASMFTYKKVLKPAASAVIINPARQGTKAIKKTFSKKNVKRALHKLF